jgi:hypothetical protein
MIKRKTIKIRNPFYGAGSPKQFNWVKDNFAIEGIGVDVNILNSYDSIDIILDKETYRISTEKAREFVKKYNSLYAVRNYKIILGVISKSILRNITIQKNGKGN